MTSGLTCASWPPPTATSTRRSARHRFRADLFYRLNVLPIDIPSPALARRDDIPLLVEDFIDVFNSEFRKRVRGATPSAQALLRGYGWPGTVRELRNVIERAMLLSDAELLDARDFTLSHDVWARPTRSACRRPASTSKNSSAAWSCRRSNGAVAIRPGPVRFSA